MTNLKFKEPKRSSYLPCVRVGPDAMQARLSFYLFSLWLPFAIEKRRNINSFTHNHLGERNQFHNKIQIKVEQFDLNLIISNKI